MKRNRIWATAVVVACLLTVMVSAGEKTNGMTDDDWKKFAEVVSTQDENQVKATLEVTQEATCFFAFLAQSGALTATPTNIVKEFFVAPYPPTFVPKYPLRMLAEVTLRDAAAGKQRYLVEKASTNAVWRMTEGSTLSPTGQKLNKLPLPSEAAQKAANKMLGQ